MSLGDDVINVIIGVIGSLLSLWLLFSIKPSLRLTWEVGFRSTKWWKEKHAWQPREDRAQKQ